MRRWLRRGVLRWLRTKTSNEAEANAQAEIVVNAALAALAAIQIEPARKVVWIRAFLSNLAHDGQGV